MKITCDPVKQSQYIINSPHITCSRETLPSFKFEEPLRNNGDVYWCEMPKGAVTWHYFLYCSLLKIFPKV